MLAALTCRACAHSWQLGWNRGALAALTCPACGQAALARASEDFAAAVEDALCQLAWLGRAFQLELNLSTRALPPPFVPAPAPGAPEAQR